MAWVIYHKFKEKLLTQDNTIDFDGTDSGCKIKVALAKANYSPDVTAHDFWADVSASEVSGSGYSAGGNLITSKSVSTSSGTVTFDASNPATWAQNDSGFGAGSSSASNAIYAILYKDTSSAATAPLIAYNEFSTGKNNISGDLAIQFSASNGIFTLA